MPDQQRPMDDAQSLGERLRAEARASRPEFSDSLYAATCQAVRQRAALKPRPARRAGWRRVLVAVAASLLAAAVFVWQGWHNAAPQPVAQEDTPADANSVPSAMGVSLATTNLDALTALIDQLDNLVNPATQWADLDHDARLAVETFTDRLPIRQVSSLGQSEYVLFQ
jgi:hypothetical protein